MSVSAVPIAYPPELPISARREDLLAAIAAHQVVIVAGETGSGKSTQLPKLCLELGRTAIVHTQPRRLAARTVAQRIADELGVALGGAVGYAVRFHDQTGEETLLRLVTDGLLLAEIQRDPLLRRYDTVIVDEAHERSLNVDFLLGCVKRILPQRPELKLIVTSATIDPERFSRHFGDAPIVQVSGRTYPVELRWRPLGEQRDQLDGIRDAVGELLREGPGDVLVFLSGEREIRDAAEALRGRLGPDVELLPLYARLSSADQQRVFAPHDGRRIVLATNVAETSLTVPGVRYVVDPGTARVSRYSARLKVQRLPIEPVSQASADQRAGRCGRIADGICIRLYDEEDYAARPRYTDPEILRTSLAAVILQMEARGLGAVEAFPFLDPPDRRQVHDGVLLLQELGALDEHRRLTRLGRRLARLPVDPRLGRMVLEAGRLGCAREVTAIAAALSIQDPRERPAEQREEADALHARFDGGGPDEERSDFLALLRLWRHLRTQQRALSGSRFRRMCRAEHLHFLRVREWQDLVAQLRDAAKRAGVALNDAPAESRAIHTALLAGLLSHVGLRDERRGGYLGARGARFALSPGSALARRREPDWVMVAELVETTRLWGRTAARVDPAWIEPLARHLVRRAHDDPRWDRRRAAAVATERVTLYGLPIVAGRTVPYARIDRAHARVLFLRHALLEGEWDAQHAFLAENRRRVEEVEALEHRTRRRGLLAGEHVRLAFFDARVPEDVATGADFERWWREAGARDPQLLVYPRELLLDRAAAEAVDPDAWPQEWRAGDVTLPLSHRFEPGAARDGVTVHVPLPVLGQVRPEPFDWLVPGLRAELVTTLLRALPKEQRRALAPIAELAAAVVAGVDPARDPLPVALSREVERLRGVKVAPEAWDLAGLPAHLRPRFRIDDEQGNELAEGEQLDALRGQVRPLLQHALAASAGPQLARGGLRAWDLGTLPREVSLPGTGGAVRAYPALVDEGETVGVRVLDTPEAQAAAMHAGTRRLLRLTVRSPVPYVVERLDMAAKLTLSSAPHGDVGAALEDVVVTALDALIAAGGGPAWDEAGFARLRDHVAGSLAEQALALTGQLVQILDLARELELALDALPSAFQDARLDVARQLGRLVFPGFAAAAGAARLPDVERYLRGALQRLERLPNAPAPDRDKLRAIRELEDAHARARAAWPADRPLPPALRELPWLLEELRVAQFANGLGAGRGVSAKRIRRLLDEAAAARV